MNYKHFRIKAVLDWIELEIRTLKPTHAWVIQKAFDLHFVEPLDKGPGGAATIFLFRIQDPRSWQHVTTRCGSIRKGFPFACEPRVTAIEIALDAYSKSQNRSDLELIRK